MGVTSVCVTLYNRGNLQVVNVVAEKTLAKSAANSVAHDSASVSWLVPTLLIFQKMKQF